CASGFADCDGDKSTNGCETNIDTNVNNCGGCAMACSTANITRTCSPGSCAGGTCAAGFGSCDRSVGDGCEAILSSAVANYGGCGASCSSTNIAMRTCASGVCTGTCSSGFADCDGDKRSNGCETNLNTSVTNCGGCAMACSTANITRSCSLGSCEGGSCAAGFADCNAN